jgi:hypothetical protein
MAALFFSARTPLNSYRPYTEESQDLAKCSCTGTEHIARRYAGDRRRGSHAICIRRLWRDPAPFPARNESKFAHLNHGLWRESSFMRASFGTPSIVPHGEEHDVYVVEHDPGTPGRVWAQVDSEAAGFETVVTDLLTGQYTKPVRVVVFNVAGGWCRDTSVEVAHELRRRCDLQLRAARPRATALAAGPRLIP